VNDADTTNQLTIMPCSLGSRNYWLFTLRFYYLFSCVIWSPSSFLTLVIVKIYWWEVCVFV